MDRKQIEDIYPLSPMQQGMLFDTIYLEGTGIYVERNAVQLTGKIDTAAFERAWNKVIARHPNLRTLFLWENRDTPLQVVRKEVELTIQHLDWRSLPADTHLARLEQFLDNERQNEFDLKRAPLLRLLLIQTAAESYYFCMIFHHIIIDRWSIGLLLNEFFAFYQAEQKGEQVRLAPVRPFGDYIGWLQQQDPQKLETFWRENLAGFSAPTPFNIEKTRHPFAGKTTYKQAETWLDEDSLARLSAFARQHRLTLNTIVQGAWALLLSHYSGDSDLLFGATVAGRPAELPGVEQMVGLFINTLPVRIQTPPNTPLIDWLQALQAHTVTLQQVSHTPLVDVQRWSNVAPGSPLFESILVFENIPLQSLPPDVELKVSAIDITVRGQMAYPLTVTVSPGHKGQMWLQLTFDEERFEAQAIQRLAVHLKNLLQNIPEYGPQPLSAVPYLSPAEEAQLLHEFSGTAAETALSTHLIHQLIEKQAAQTPTALALATIKTAQRPSFFLDAGQEMPQASLTYAELNRRANQLAHHLVKMGVGPEKVVALHRARSAETLICLLAVLKAGGVFLPIDPALPEQRLAHILADARPALIITDIDSRADWQGIPTFCPEQNAEQLVQNPAHNLQTPLSPANSAYLIYTSGTTGQPKGTLIPHRALINHSQAIVKQFELSPTDRVLQFAALSFDVALEEIFPTWLAGAALILRPLDIPALDQFNQLIAAERLTVVNIPAPYWHEWVSEIARTPFFTPAHSLRLVIVGSDKVMAEKLAQWQEAISDPVKLLNGYGPTETTITAAFYKAASLPDGLSVVPLGRPLANITTYVLDRNGRPTPIGVIGELYIGGAGLAHGYLNQPGQTAAAFVPHPFSAEPGQRLYRTGDLVRWLPDGNLAFIGRTDHQVKIRGFRIELEEIENNLNQHSGIRQAVVIADEHHERLAAYVLPNDFSLTPKTLQNWAQSKLPDYMVPTSWMFLEEFPLTVGGKVNRQALPKPTFSNGTNAYVPPRREDEQIIAAIWSQVLETEKVGIHDNFFQLGGHSLRATQIVSRIRQQLGWDVPVRAIFESPTIAGLTARYAPEPITDDEVMAELLDQLEGLSDLELDDLELLLDPEMPAASPPNHLVQLTDSAWAIWRDVVIRAPGFPAQDVLKLSLTACAEAADRLADAEKMFHDLQKEILIILSDKSSTLLDQVQQTPEDSPAYQQIRDDLRQLKKAKKRLSRGDSPTESDAAYLSPELVAAFQSAQQTMQACQQQFQRLFAEGDVEVSRALHEIGRNPRYREAITWQNRQAIHTAIDNLLQTPPDEMKNRKTRKREELVAFYAQRYSVKNDTIGFFGPILWAKINNNPNAMTINPDTELPATRTVYFEDWGIEVLAETLSTEAFKPWFVPRLLPHLHLDNGILYMPMGRSAQLSAEETAVLAACDGRKMSCEIAQMLISDPSNDLQSQEDVYTVLQILRDKRRINWAFEIPTEDPFPEKSLRRLLERIDNPVMRQQALQPLNELEAARSAVAAAAGNADQLDHALEALNTTFTRLTDAHATRRSGEFYAARTLVYEDCRRNMAVEIGDSLIRELETSFKLLLDSARWYTFETANLYRDALRKAFKETLTQFPHKTGDGIVDFSTFWLWAQPLFFGDGPLPADSLQALFQNKWETILSLPEGQRRVSYTASALQSHVAELFNAPRSGWGLARYHAPDVMLAASSVEDIRAGNYQFVLGEFHIGFNALSSSCFFNQHPAPQEMLQNFQADLQTPNIATLESTAERGETSRTRFVLNAPDDVRVVFSYDKCPHPETEWTTIGQLVVEEVGDELIVRTRDGRHQFDMMSLFDRYTGSVILNRFKILGQRDYTPRITIDKLVIQRESWRISAGNISFAFEQDPEQQFLRARQWMRHNQMPRFIFVKSPIETKPVYIDFASPLYVQILSKLIRQMAESELDNPKIAITEMYPSHDKLWLTDAGGRRYTSELRLAVLDTSS